MFGKQARYLEAIENFTLMDDTFMRVVFKDKDCVQLLLDTIFKEHIDIALFETQYDLTNLYGRSLRVDILVETMDGRFINIDVQNDKEGAHPRRLLFHESLIDANVSEPNDNWKEMSHISVVFICKSDVLGSNEPIYYLHTTCDQTGERIENKSEMIYVNGEIQDSSPLGRLMHDFHCMKAEDMYYEVLRKRVKYFKESKGGKRKMCKIMDDIVKQEKMESERIGEAKGRLEGKMEGKIDVIKNYADESHMTLLEAMVQLHISQHDQQLIMRYL
ncbi:MAG: PD-(D/E)XK nuclease family transposase [Longibaculum sp.]